MLAIVGDAGASQTDTSIQVWFVLLGMACTVLASMVVLVLIEAFVPVGTVPPPLVWGRGLRARLAHTRRYWQLVDLGIRNGLGPYLRDVRRRGLDTPDGRTQFGRALARTFDAGGVTFVKLGQVLATRRDLIPAEVADELTILQDQAQPVSWPDVEAVVRAELGAPVDDLFGTSIASHWRPHRWGRSTAPGYAARMTSS